MSTDPDIRDQSYQFFIQEAAELLQVIETELLTLKLERSPAKVHSLMRAAHSIKGGAACVGLEPIKALAHRLEDIFKALHHQELEIDDELESMLLQAYDCLRLPLMEEITTGHFNAEQAMAIAEPVLAQIEAQIGDFLKEDDYLPTSTELGIDITKTIFEMDVAEGLERLNNILAHPQGYEVSGELRAQAEVFTGIAELLSLPGFGAIAQTTLAALNAHPEQALSIAQLALADFEAGKQAVIAGDRTQGGTPSVALTKLTCIEKGVGKREEVQEPGNEGGSQKKTPQNGQTSEVGNFVELDVLKFPILPPAKETTEQELVSLATEDNTPSLDDIFGGFGLDNEITPDDDTVGQASSLPLHPSTEDAKLPNLDFVEPETQDDIQTLIESIEQTYQNLPPLEEIPPNLETEKGGQLGKQDFVPETSGENHETDELADLTHEATQEASLASANPTAHLSVRVDLDRLERMNNLIGELAINRNSLSLQNEQLQGTVQELLRRFDRFQQMANYLRDLSDKMLINPERRSILQGLPSVNLTTSPPLPFPLFDSLELDSYGELHSLLQDTLEEMVQLEETVGDVVLLARQSSQTLEGQRQMIGHLRDDLMWARMLPLSKGLSGFPRLLRDLSTTYHKPVELKLVGTGVLVDKAALEKLYDPLVHLVRNAFDHGIESPEVRRQQNKPERGQIEIRAYHQGSQTIIEVRDDGQGIHPERIRNRALELGLLSSEQLATISTEQLFDLLFRPGFSTTSQVNELSGRGVGLDVVLSQLRALKGTVTVKSTPGRGTTFTLRIPLTLTIAKLLVCLVGSGAYALPADSIEEILIPKLDQVKHSGKHKFLHWRQKAVPVYHLSKLLEYTVPLPESTPSQALVAVPSPEEWAAPILLIRQDKQFLALEVDRLVTEQELVIKPFGLAIAPPSYIYGCTILGDGSLIPVIDGVSLLNQVVSEGQKPFTTAFLAPVSLLTKPESPKGNGEPASSTKSSLILIVDDSIALRQTLILTLQKAGYRVLPARDGREAVEQVQQNPNIDLIVCDIEMPNMNGFEFLNYRRQSPLFLKIPVIMLTSRSSDKHRRLAMQLGADSYFTKPYLDQDFLTAIKNLVNQKESIEKSYEQSLHELNCS